MMNIRKLLILCCLLILLAVLALNKSMLKDWVGRFMGSSDSSMQQTDDGKSTVDKISDSVDSMKDKIKAGIDTASDKVKEAAKASEDAAKDVEADVEK